MDEGEQAVLRDESLDGTLLPGERGILEQWAHMVFGDDVTLLAYRADASWLFVEILGPATATSSGHWQPIFALGGGRTPYDAACASERAYIAAERSVIRRTRASCKPFCITGEEADAIRAFSALGGDPGTELPEQVVMSGTWEIDVGTG